ncbi:MAG TPA: hypothetical protein VIY71_10740 [Solirubrobacterales bacterium]
MRRTQTVSSPDGDQWQVRRRWLDRPLPKIRRALQNTNDESALEAALESGLKALSAPADEDSIPLAIGVAVAVALLVLILLPLIGVALEIAVLLVLLISGIVGRVLLRRPWTIEAVNLNHPQRSAAFAVKGWRRSTHAIDELATTIPVSGLPQQISEGILVPA